MESRLARAWNFIAGWAVYIDTPDEICCDEGKKHHGYELDDNSDHHYWVTMVSSVFYTELRDKDVLFPPRAAPSLVWAVAAIAPPEDCTMRAARSSVRNIVSTATK